MGKIKVNISKSIFIPKFFPFLLDYSRRWEFWMGSAGSGKSYFITQKLLLRASREKIKILVCRRYASTLRNTCFSLFKDVINKWHLQPFVKINESDFRITFLHNGSEIIFLGLDNEEKLLSLNNVGTIFIEEAYEVPKTIVEQLNLRLRGNTPNQQILMAWNPISKDSWLYDFTVTNPPANSVFIHSTYKDNSFLNADYVAALEEMYTRNPQKARIYCDGEWGIDSEGLVFQNWRVEDFNPLALSAQGLEMRVGSDLGFVDATTIVCSLFDRENKRIYIYDEFYKSGCQLDEVAEAMEKMNLKHTKIFMDSAEPRSIQFFKHQGFNTVPCIKGRDSVKARILFLQNHEIIIHPSCKDVIREFENFSYIKDKKTDRFSDSMTHEFSHSIDGLGYAYSDIYTQTRMKTINKSALGL